jgi:hypothetical protein
MPSDGLIGQKLESLLFNVSRFQRGNGAVQSGAAAYATATHYRQDQAGMSALTTTACNGGKVLGLAKKVGVTVSRLCLDRI